MSKLRISLFGRFRVMREGEILTSIDANKARELLCYLLLHQTKPHARETLAGNLWGDSSTIQSKKYLRQAIWLLQGALDTAAPQPEHNSILLIEPDWIQIDPAANLWLDVAEFQEAFTQTQSIPGNMLSSQQAQELQAAVALYCGDLLDGWYQDWCLFERERLQNMYLTMLDKLSRYCEIQGDYEGGLTYAEEILSHDPAHERSHRQVMRLLYLSGDRTSALRRYERCVAALEQELGIKPSEHTNSLYEQIKADQLVSTDTSRTATATPRETLPFLAQVSERINQIQIGLINIQREVQLEIQTVRKSGDPR